MRWYWIDRFLEFESGRHARAIKNVSLAEEHLHDHFPYYPLLPNALIIEGLAQTGGLLVCEYNQFVEKVVLAKIASAQFYLEAAPGDSLIYTATILAMKEDGAVVSGVSHKNGQLQAEVELVFAHANNVSTDALYDPEAFLRMMRMLGAFDVGHAADGSPLKPPMRLLSALGAGALNW
jgi:3-hydroxyacyl-[acyl-carrier-protein] dehydratase